MKRILPLLFIWCVAASPCLGEADEIAETFKTNACVQCHQDLPGRLGQIVQLEWNQSVHYQAKVGCEGCHGGNALVQREQFDSDEAFKQGSHLQRHADFLVKRPDRQAFVRTVRGRSVSYLCGKCHASIKEKHLGSPHGNFGDPTCLYCHGQGSHRITKPSIDLIDTRSRSEQGRCSPCHRAATMTAVTEIKKILLQTQTNIENSQKSYQQLKKWGYHNLELEELNEHVDEVQSRLRRIFHSFNMREINNFASEIQDVADRTEVTFEMIDQLQSRRLNQAMIGVGVIAMIVAFVTLLLYYKKTFLKHDDDEPPHL